MNITGPGSPFELLVDREGQVLSERNIRNGRGLPDDFRRVYGGDWVLPGADQGVYTYSNFVVSRDGRVSFAIEGHEGGGDVSGFNPHDQWLMGLLRARADAVIVGAQTLRSESEHIWTAEFIFPTDTEAFHALRASEGRNPHPLQVFVTRTGNINPDAAVFHDPQLHCVVLTTQAGASRLTAETQIPADVVIAGQHDVDLQEAIEQLQSRYGVHTLLCEGGPRLYAAVIEAGQLDEEFVTTSPLVIGTSSESPRPGLVEGSPSTPDNPRTTQLVSLRIAGEHLFSRTRWS